MTSARVEGTSAGYRSPGGDHVERTAPTDQRRSAVHARLCPDTVTTEDAGDPVIIAGRLRDRLPGSGGERYPRGPTKSGVRHEAQKAGRQEDRHVAGSGRPDLESGVIRIRRPQGEDPTQPA